MNKPERMTASELQRKFIPGYMNSFGEFHPLPRSERWGDIQFDEEWPMMQQKMRVKKVAENAAQRARNLEQARKAREREMAIQAFEREHPDLHREIRAQIDELRRLNGLARAAAENVQNPRDGDFKKDSKGKLFRWTTKPFWQVVKSGPANAPINIPSPKNGDIKKLGSKFYRWTTTPSWREVRRDTDYNLDLADTYARTNRLGKPYLDARDILYEELYPGVAPIRRPAAYQRRNTRRNRRANTRRKMTRKS